MRIGIDISQLAYRNTGVANYLKNLIIELVNRDSQNEYVLFYSSLRRTLDENDIPHAANVTLRSFYIPPRLLSFLWNTLHIIPVEQLIGPVDLFLTSDWTEPPTRKAKKLTILYDLIIKKYPEEMADIIVSTQKEKLAWVKKESSAILCISEATKSDAQEILGINKDRLHVIYPGFTL